jgi:hypothetical protein
MQAPCIVKAAPGKAGRLLSFPVGSISVPNAKFVIVASLSSTLVQQQLSTLLHLEFL